MPQFNLQLSNKTLRLEDEASVRAFAARTDWTALPSSAKLHGTILRALLSEDDYDLHTLAEGLRALAGQRMALYADALVGTAELGLWLEWLERIDEFENVDLDDAAADLDLLKKELALSIEMMEHSKELLHINEPASSVLFASACEIGEAANVCAFNDITQRMQRVQVIAELAKSSSFDEHADTPKVSPCVRSEPLFSLPSQVVAILRWIGVLPAGIAAYFGIQIVVAVGNIFNPDPESFVNAWCQFINSIAGPYCFVLAGAKTAPSHKFITAIVLTVLFSLASGLLFALAFQYQGRLSTSIWWLAASGVIGLVAAIVACMRFHHEEPQYPNV